MRTGIEWFIIFTKRYWKKGSFLGIMILFPILIFVLGDSQKKEKQKVQIGLFWESEPLIDQMGEKLLGENETFSFYRVGSIRELKEKVASRNMECGFAFLPNYEKHFKERTLKNQIQVYYSPSSVLQEMSKELIFAAFMNTVSQDIMDDVMKEQFHVRDLEKLEKFYQKYGKEGETFHFQFEEVETIKTDEKMISPLALSWNIHGMIGVYLLAVGLFSGAFWFVDQKKGIFQAGPYSFRHGKRLIAIGTPVIWSGITAYIGLLLATRGEQWYLELLYLLVYMVGVILVSDLVRSLFSNAIILSSLIPGILISCFIICPVFFNISLFLPRVIAIQKWYFPMYYIQSSLRGELLLIVGGICVLYILRFQVWKK